jgi:hypothetical protein
MEGFVYSEVCHPERSVTPSEASRRAQSKDPCKVSSIRRCIKVFSPSPRPSTLRPENWPLATAH